VLCNKIKLCKLYNGGIKLDKVLELCLRSIVCFLNEEEHKAKTYKNKALELHNKVTFEEECVFKVEERIPKQVKKKLYEIA
jgi:hypothetical protein